MLRGAGTETAVRTKPGRGRGSGRWKERLEPYLYLAPSLIVLVIFVFYPILRSIYLSLFLTDPLGNPKVFIGFEHYASQLSGTFLQSLLVTLKFVLYTVPVGLALGFILALLAYQQLKGSRVFQLIFSSPLAVSAATGATIFLMMLNPVSGIVNYVLGLFGIQQINWLTDPKWALWAVGMVSICLRLGFNFVLMLSGLQNVPEELCEAALVDGAGPWARTRHITLPMISPTIFFALVVGVIHAFQVFTEIDMMTSGGPSNSTSVLVFQIYQEAFRKYEFGAASAQAILLFSLLAGCGGSSGTTSSGGSGGTQSSGGTSQGQAATQSGGKVKVVFWHAMGGKNGEAVDYLVEKFNNSQDRIVVEAAYQGTYDEALQKMKAAGTDGPTMIQVYEIGSRFMIDSGLITPMQDFIDAENYSIDDLEPNILGYDTFDGWLYSMPFNTSTPIVYYNKDAFREAGLDPEKPPKTMEEFREYARLLTKTEGGDTRYGAGIAWYGWFFEQFLAVQGAHYVDNDNGRSAKATKATINTPEGQKILAWLKAMIDDGSAVNLGRKTNDTQAAFSAGRIAMTLDSTAVLSTILSGVGDKFEVGTAFLPRPQGIDGGVIIGGASVWITNVRPKEEQQAAWEFVKWLVEPEQQAEWSIRTGYFPVRKAAYDQQVLKDWHAERPQFTTAIEQLRASKLTTATQGAVIGTFPQARQIVEEAMEAVVLGQKTPEQALAEAEAEAEITKGIQQYNLTTQ